MPKPKVDLTTATGRQFAEVIAAAVKLGVRDATGGLPVKSGNDLILLFAYRWRYFHKGALKSAYSAGRDHVEVAISANKRQEALNAAQ